MAQQTTPWSKVVDSLFQSNEAVLDALTKGNERGYRFSKRLISEAEQGRQELIRLRRRFQRQPKDMRTLYQESVDVARRAAGHAAQLAKEVVAGATEGGRDVRETAKTVVQANRSAGQAMVAAVQAAASDLSRRPSARPRKAAAPRKRARRVVKRTTRRTASRQTDARP